MLNVFKRYRKALDLSALPSAGEKLPLLANHRDGTAITSTRYVRADIPQQQMLLISGQH